MFVTYFSDESCTNLIGVWILKMLLFDDQYNKIGWNIWSIFVMDKITVFAFIFISDLIPFLKGIRQTTHEAHVWN